MSEPGDDFWNFGPFGISPKNQVEFLVKVHEGRLPFSKRNLQILKSVMINERKPNYILRAKTGWTRVNGQDIGWWVGYVERKGNLYFFATRITKPRAERHPNFGQCRKDITRTILHQLQAIE
ncbi:MAG: penicillin-binding transpeptidase domain-containing protein [Haliscomenobacter sp.]|nr:penicillin-binding transpeptidase domain-containing protein [Haliscomenobacter sp.]MDX2070220.1 penicillin-binding transpeptidase domain-containing protein [Haliscomenobacter sp.]